MLYFPRCFRVELGKREVSFKRVSLVPRITLIRDTRSSRMINYFVIQCLIRGRRVGRQEHIGMDKTEICGNMFGVCQIFPTCQTLSRATIRLHIPRLSSGAENISASQRSDGLSSFRKTHLAQIRITFGKELKLTCQWRLHMKTTSANYACKLNVN